MHATDPTAAPPRRRHSVTRRHLHRGHFGFLRAIVQGLHGRPMWERYLADEGEIAGGATVADGSAAAFANHPKVRRVSAWLRLELSAAATRAAQHRVARLIKVDFRRISRPSEALPSLEDFSAAEGLDGFRQAEQLEAYRARFGRSVDREVKRGRLIQLQLEAIDWLEATYAQPVLVGDGCRAWLSDSIADRLLGVGVTTLGDLLDRINSLGTGWTRALAGVGVSKARAIEAFLDAHRETLGTSIGAHVAVPRRQRYAHELARVMAPSSGLVPLDKLIVPAELDGRQGAFRRPQAQCLLSAHNDYEAVLAWLRAKPGLAPDQIAALRAKRKDIATVPGPFDWLNTLSNTQRAYRKEAERLLLWAVLVRNKPLSSMTREDCMAYRDFLASPPADWCAPRSRERWSAIWRPFEGPLSKRAQAYALVVLGNLYGYLVDQNYLMGNPWRGIHAPREAKPTLDVGRSFTEAQWHFVQAQLAALPYSSANTRLQVALALLYATGLRLSEAIAVTTDHLEWVSLPRPGSDGPIEGWWLDVVGKGNKQRRVPVSPNVIALLEHYLRQRDMTADFATGRVPRGATLLARATDVGKRAPWSASAKATPAAASAGITADGLYKQLKRFFGQCADAIRPENERDAERFMAASVHWLRHTNIVHALAKGVPLEVVQQNAGHASLDTTTRYVTTEEALRMEAIERMGAKT